MAAAAVPFAARLHAAVGWALDWAWPAGAAWAYGDAVAQAPREPDLHFRRGDALGRAGRWPDAARSFAAAACLRPVSVEYQGALAVALDRAGRARDLVVALRRFAELRPCEGEVHVLLGAVLRRCGQQAEALKAFRLAVRLAPARTPRRFLLGEMLLGTRGWQDAVAAWQEARQIESPIGCPLVRKSGHSALNFHPGRRRDQVSPRPPASPRRGLLVRAGERWKRLVALVWVILTRPIGAAGREARVRVIRRAWRRAHPGPARRPGARRPGSRRNPGEAA
jgi:tetratricopeptide (TPR) repeat protein